MGKGGIFRFHFYKEYVTNWIKHILDNWGRHEQDERGRAQ